MSAYDEEEVEAAVLSLLREMNAVLDELAADGWIVTFKPAGHLYEAHIVTPDGILVLRPEEVRKG